MSRKDFDKAMPIVPLEPELETGIRAQVGALCGILDVIELESNDKPPGTLDYSKLVEWWGTQLNTDISSALDIVQNGYVEMSNQKTEDDFSLKVRAGFRANLLRFFQSSISMHSLNTAGPKYS